MTRWWEFWEAPSFLQASAWAAIFLGALSVLMASLPSPRKSLLLGLLAGVDGRWSTSKTANLLWLYAVSFALIAVLIHTDGAAIGEDFFAEEYLLVLGFPAAAAVAAKAVTAGNVADGDVTTKAPADRPEANPLSGLAQLVSDDHGRGDLGDFQYFAFNLLLLGFFFARWFTEKQAALPDLPDTLLGLTGVSAAAYVGKKGFERDVARPAPDIRSLNPPKARPGARVVVMGTNLATVAWPEARVYFGGASANVHSVQIRPTHAAITVDVPATLQPGEVDVVVTAYDGVQTGAHTFTVV